MHLLIIRGDNLGDLCMLFPTLGWIKHTMPDVRLSIIVRPYTLPLLEYAPVDTAYVWNEQDPEENKKLLIQLAPEKCLVLGPLSPYLETLLALPQKPAIYTRWTLKNFLAFPFLKVRWLWFFFKSHLHESIRQHLLVAKTLGVSKTELLDLFDLKVHLHVKKNPFTFPLIKKPYIVLHVFSYGHGREWPLLYFARLAHLLTDKGFTCVIAGSLAERVKADPCRAAFPAESIWFFGQCTLAEYIAVLKEALVVVASGTGPLHIASILGVQTVGLFPAAPVIGVARWAPIGPKSLLVSPPHCLGATFSKKKLSCSGQLSCLCMDILTPQHVLKALVEAMPDVFAKLPAPW